MSLSKYPNEYDLFEVKTNAISQDDENGDYVMADDVNALQDAVLAIEKALGVNPQGAYQTIGERFSSIGVTALRVPSVLFYLGKPAEINGASTITQAVDQYLKYDHIVFGNNVQEPSNAYHESTQDIIAGVKSNTSVSFYGYIDCGVSTSNLSIGEIQVKINQWRDMGVTGIFVDNFGYDKGVGRARQNLILDSIHQYNMVAMIGATNLDNVLSDTMDPDYNPDWTAPNIVEGDIYYYNQFTISNGVYEAPATLFANLGKLYQYRLSLGIKIFGCAMIPTTFTIDVAQAQYDYAHTMAMLASLDAFGANNQDRGATTATVVSYDTVALVGEWYSKNPDIAHTSGNTIHTRRTAFGSIKIDTTNHTYEVSGITVPSTFILPIPNSVSGVFIKDATIDDVKIYNYNGNRLIDAINDSEGFIDLERIEGLTDVGGGISEGLLQANVLQALNASIGNLDAGQASIGVLTAGEITTGKLTAERIAASVVAAINLYAAEMEVGSATIDVATIGALTAEHIEAAVIEAININAKGADIENLNADHITAGDIAADRIRSNIVTAINLYAQNMDANSAKINVAAIGELTANHIVAKVIEAINLSTDTAKIHSAQIQDLTADKIQAAVIEAINISTDTATINSARIGVLTADKLTANVVEAINLAAESATIDGARIRDLNADYITAGSIATDRMTANVIDAVNLKAGIITTGSAIIDAGAIGTLSADHIQASVISAINASIENVTINAARIGELEAANIKAGAIIAGKLAANAVEADNIAADAVTAGKIAADAVEAGNIAADAITARELAADSVEAEQIKADAVVAGKIAADAIGTRELKADAVEAENIKAGAIVADKIFAGAVTADKLAADAITANHIKAVVVAAINLSAEFISGGRIEARTINADRIISGSISTTELAAGAVTADKIAAGAITANKIQAGSIDASHISTEGLDAEIINVYNPTTGEVLIGGGYLRVDGLDVGVVQSDNLVINGLFLTASSAYGSWRDNEAGEVILGSQGSAPGGHQVWKINTTTGAKVAAIDIPGKKPYGIAIDANEKYAYVTVQGDNTIVQMDMTNNVITTNMLKTDAGPAVIKTVGGHLADSKHLFALATDPDDVNIPDSLMVIDAAPTSINSSLYMHHHLPLGNRPFDLVVDTSHRTFVTMADQGDILIFEMHDVNSTTWKVTGRIPITAYGTDNYHGGLPGTYGLNAAVGGSAAISYEKAMSHGGGHMHAHGGYGAASGTLTEYEPRGIALSADDDTLFVSDFKNNQLVVVSKSGSAYYNPLTGTRERGNLGEWGIPNPMIAPSQGGSDTSGGGGHEHSVYVPEPEFTIQTLPTPPSPLPPFMIEDPTPQISGVRDYTDTNGETKYVRYRIDIGDAPEFVERIGGKLFISLSGSGQIAVIDEQPIIDKINADRALYYNEFANFPAAPHFEVRYINVGAKPSNLLADPAQNKLYVSVTGQNQVAKIDVETEEVEQMINVGANPRGMAITADGTSLYVVNHGGSGSLSFVYPEGNYIGDAYIGMEGQINHHGAHGWMPNRSDWVKDAFGNVVTSSTIEFRINEPFLNEGGYVRISAQGKHYQLATIEQDVMNVTNYSDGTNPAGTLFRYHNGSAQIAIAAGSSPKFTTKFEIDEFVPKVVVYDNQQTEPFTPTEDNVHEEYDGLEYSAMTNRALGATVTSSATPTSGMLMSIVDGNEPIDTNEENGDSGGHGGHHMMSVDTEEPVFTIMHSYGETVTFPSGLQSVTIDLGKVYMVPKIVVMHSFHKPRKYHGTKTEVSVNGTDWITVFDSAVSGEYKEFTIESMVMDGMMMDHYYYGNHIEFPAKPIRYVRDWANGYTEYDGDVTVPAGSGENAWASPVERTDNHWTEIKVYGDWEVIYGDVYPENTDKAGQPLASNGQCYVATDISKAYVAHDIQIEFTSWSWMTYIGGPTNGTLAVEMPSLMSSDHFVDQNWTYKTNIPHKHIMLLTPSVNIKENEMMGVKAGKHRIVFRQSSGRVTIDKLRYDDFQYFASSSSLISATNSATFRRQPLLAEQAKAYQGIGRQSTEGAYDEVRTSPDSGLPDKSVPIKYRFRVKCQLDPSDVEERGIAYVTSCIFETGKQSTHWRMSQSGDLFPGTRIEPWDPGQPHKTGIQSFHLANGSVRGSKIMPNTVMNHHISPYARIAEFKLDLNYPTHGHGRMTYPNGPMLPVWVDNKMVLDSIEGWGNLVDDGMGMMVEDEHSGISNRLARADHDHDDKYPKTTGTPGEGKVPVFRTALSNAEWSLLGWGDIGGKPTEFPPEAHEHGIADISDLTANFYNKTEVDALIESGGGPGGGGGGDVLTTADNVMTGTNSFTKPGLAIKIQPNASVAGTVVLAQILNNGGTNLFSIRHDGLINAVNMTLTGNVTAATMSTGSLTGTGAITTTGNISTTGTGTLSIAGTSTLSGLVTLGAQATGTGHAVRADRSISAGTGLAGGGNLTADRTISVNFGTTAGTVAQGNHTHSEYLSNADGQVVGKNFTVNGALYVGPSSGGAYVAPGDIYLRTDLGQIVARITATTNTNTSNYPIFLNANGSGEFAGTIKINTLQVTNTGVVTNLNAEKLNGVTEPELVKTASINDLTSWGVDWGCEVQAQAIPNMTVKVTAGVIYTSSGKRWSFSGTDSVSLAVASTNFNRWDVVYVRGASSGANEGSIAVATGTASATPVKPSIPADAVRLADVYVRQNVGTITDGYNRGSGTTDGSYDAIDDTRIYRGLRYVDNKLQVKGHLRATNSAAKVTIPAGQTSVTWNHGYGATTYAISVMANSSARHIHYKNLAANSIDITIEDAYTSAIDVLVTLVGY